MNVSVVALGPGDPELVTLGAWRTLRRAIRCRPDAAWHYFENVGTSGERHLTEAEAILQSRFPYFSLLIVKPQ